MINLTQEEIWAFNIISNSLQSIRTDLNQAVGARNSYIQLLEAKYNATFNPQSGQFEPKPEEKKGKGD